ncbi:MAG: beta-Ala-His dipeptidase, partial [Clostridia bacterium]|nr:beta-Ala-His dipeptidase [Clostridia bacterium]
LILQGHMDMVCEKRPDVEHDFATEGLKLKVNGDYLSAEGTTLGGDDGIAVAYGLAILDSKDLCHPALEVLFTVDEEIGLLGADGFDCSVLKGRRMINLDSEEEGRLWVSCAGGVSGNSYLPVQRVEAAGHQVSVRICGLTGGHSGAEIHKNRASANILMGQFLYELGTVCGYALKELEGGQKENAIPRECTAILLALPEEISEITSMAEKMQKEFREEYTGSDEGITIQVTDEGETEAEVLHPTSQEKVIFYLMNLPFGVKKMSGTIDGLVETSCNPGILKLYRDELFVQTSIRSSVGTAKEALSHKIQYLTEFLGGEYDTEGDYPAWEYRKDSKLRDKMVEVYKEMYHKDLQVVAIHAGLECGLFYERMEGLDCTSLGPDILDIHTYEERLDMSSVKRIWEYLVEVLKNLKD